MPGPTQPRGRPPLGWATVRTLAAGTVRSLFAHRVTGLAAEAGFWALASLPPLALGLLGTIGYLHGVLGHDAVADIKASILSASRAVLSAHSVDTVVKPVLNGVLNRGRGEVVSIGFVLSLWSGSRAMNVYVDAITIAHHLHGIRGVVRARLTGFVVYLGFVVIGVVLVPLLLAGPKLARRTIGHAVVGILYWPVLVGVSIALLMTLYHVALPVRTPWRRTLPGAVVALGLWVGGSTSLRIYLSTQVRAASIYGQLGAVTALLFWLYITALAVLIGAELNAQVDLVWPTPATARARAGHRGDGDIGARVDWALPAGFGRRVFRRNRIGRRRAGRDGGQPPPLREDVGPQDQEARVDG
jgi:membrane protein